MKLPVCKVQIVSKSLLNLWKSYFVTKTDKAGYQVQQF
jgi:hypothetical protein